MSILTRLTTLRLFAVGVLAACAFTIQTSPGQAQEATDINSAVNGLAGFKPTKIEIAPMVKKGSPQRPPESAWTNATPVDLGSGKTAGSLWTYILYFSGIDFKFGIPTPKELQEKHQKNLEAGQADGFLDYIGKSEVVLSGGQRATFGWFVKMEGEGGVKKDFFILMSYDYLSPDNEPGSTQAFEVFVFTAGHSSIDDRQVSTLVGGFAVNRDGTVLKEVPLAIADQRFNGNPGVAVTPGVVQDGSGCLACHSHNLDDLPQSSTPFPWTGSFYETTTPATPSTASTPGASPPAAKTPDTKTTDTKTPAAPSNKTQEAATPKTGQTGKTVSDKKTISKSNSGPSPADVLGTAIGVGVNVGIGIGGMSHRGGGDR